MDLRNKTLVSSFIFAGLTNHSILAPILFQFFLLLYLVTIIGNIGMMTLVYTISPLHTPMYYFLANLALVDLLYSTTVTPKMLSDLVSKEKSISFKGCTLQFYFFVALAVNEALLLTVMAYDRYIAICRPLHYIAIMTPKRCIFIALLVFFIAFLQSSIQTTCVFHLQFCGPNIIEHFYCDLPPLLKLSCSETFRCNTITILCTSCFGLGTLIILVISYSFIISSVFKINTSKGRSQAFSTCFSHFTCVSMFYGTVLFMYLHPPSSDSDKQDKVLSVFYCVVIPMLNPLIYSLRNKEVKNAVKGYLHKINVHSLLK
ncbi:olfactory receptor 5AR1-like [Discoglossus pictus]